MNTDERAERARNNFQSGYNCPQSVVHAFDDVLVANGIDPDTALKCAVALKKRDFAMDVLLDRIADNAVKG